MQAASKKLDFSELPVIDHHCHPWSEVTSELTTQSFLSMMNFGGYSTEEMSTPENALHAEYAPMARQILHHMAKFLGCAPRLNEVIEARNKRTRKDYWQYSRELFEDVNVVGLLVDDGYSELSVGKALSKKNFEDFQQKMHVPIKRVSRIEPHYQDAVDASSSFDDFVSRFDESINQAVKRDGAVAFKSIIAYRSGLSIQRPNEVDVRRDYAISKVTRARNVKSVRDWYIFRMVERAPELGVVIHLHTGVGDIDVLLRYCNPWQLYDLLKDPQTQKTKIFLIHAGYPFCQESAYLANVLKNVYIDLSVLLPFALAPVAVGGMLQLLDQAPVTRLLFGSDGYDIPEIHWAGAKIGKRVLEQSFTSLLEAGALDEEEIHAAAEFIFSGNAKRIYGF